jgi:cytochrome d ubiquinol oxidase subunit II
MIYVVIAFLWASLLLYLLLGGADFGAGIVELFTSSKNREKTQHTAYRAIGPIWEANHMWLIIAIVILFVGFPRIYTTMSIYLHIPLILMLVGIIARGTAFTFRHYDAVADDMQVVYRRIFIYSSFLTPFFLGIIAGSTVSGKIDTEAGSFADAYIFSWLHFFSVSVGLFTVAICGYLAAVYLIGEVKEPEDKKRYVTKAKILQTLAILGGALVFAAAAYEHIPLAQWVFGQPVGVAAVVLALASVIIFHWRIRKSRHAYLRMLAAFQVTMILLVTTYHHYPDIILLKNGDHLSLLEAQVQPKTIDALGWALVLGSIFILPALFYLLYSFQRKNKAEAI